MKNKKQILSRNSTVGLLTSLLIILFGVPSFASFGPNPDEVFIERISHGGNGCPQGSVSEMLSPDAKAFTLLFDSYIAEAGPRIPRRENRKSCQIAVDLRFPQGWSYTIFAVDYRGYANLDSGTSGIQQTTYYFQGASGSATMRSLFRGFFDDNYHIRDTLGLSALVWSPCGITRPINLNTEVRVHAAGSRQALMTIDSIDGQLEHHYGIQWRRCW